MSANVTTIKTYIGDIERITADFLYENSLTKMGTNTNRKDFHGRK